MDLNKGSVLEHSTSCVFEILAWWLECRAMLTYSLARHSLELMASDS